MVVVEVRQRTLWIAGRSWSKDDEDDEDDKDDKDDKEDEEEEERRTRQEEEEEEQEEEEEATDIKSNNPHLAGGELHILICKIKIKATPSANGSKQPFGTTVNTCVLVRVLHLWCKMYLRVLANLLGSFFPKQCVH